MIAHRVGAAVDRFWFAPRDCATLALVRIAFGAVMTVWTVCLYPDLQAFFTDEGFLRGPDRSRGTWTLFVLSRNSAFVLLVWAALLASCVALTIGYRARLAAVLVWVGVMSFERDNTLVFNSGDLLARKLALVLMLAPIGAAFSVDRWRRDPSRFLQTRTCAPWALRLIQLELSMIYLGTVWAKLRGSTWPDGTAVSYSMRLGLQRFAPPEWVTDNRVLMGWVTHGTLVLEVALGVLIWVPRLRPYVLGLGVLLHLGIEFTLRVGFFSWLMLVAYLAFVPAEWVTARARSLLLTRPHVPDRVPVQSGMLPCLRGGIVSRLLRNVRSARIT